MKNLIRFLVVLSIFVQIGFLTTYAKGVPYGNYEPMYMQLVMYIMLIQVIAGIIAWYRSSTRYWKRKLKNNDPATIISKLQEAKRYSDIIRVLEVLAFNKRHENDVYSRVDYADCMKIINKETADKIRHFTRDKDVFHEMEYKLSRI